MEFDNLNCAIMRGSSCSSSEIKYKLMWGDVADAIGDTLDYVGGPPPLGLLASGTPGEDPGLFVVEAVSGQISASPLNNGSYTLWLIAYDSDVDAEGGSKTTGIPQEYDQVVLAKWEFDVITSVKFDLVLKPAPNGTDVLPRTEPDSKSTREYTDPTRGGDYFVGETYKFAPRTIDTERTTVSTPTNTAITYTLSENAPDSMYVHAKYGVIFGEFEEVLNYSFSLIAVDAGGKKEVVENYTFPVTARGKFTVEVEAFDYNNVQPTSTGRDYLPADYSDLSDADKVYVLGETYRFPPITITSVSHTQDAADQIGFTMVGMDGFLIDPTDGYIQGTPNSKGTFNMTLFAVDSRGNQAIIGTSSTSLVFKQLDTDVPAFGPNEMGCLNNGKSIDDDEHLFDKSFTCDCTGLQYNGDNCEIARAAPSVASAEMVSGSLIGAFAIVLVMLYVGYRFRIHHIKMQAIDFEEHMRELIESGDLDIQVADGVAEGVPKTPREIKRDHLTLIETIGKGAFGAVWKCTLDETSAGGTPSYLVAAKTVLDIDKKPEARDELVSEAIVMAQLTGHLNVVSLVGVITRGDPLVLILSYCEHGSLLSYIRGQHKAGTTVELEVKRRLLMEVACGMQHLAASRYIHRDLAARNVLIASGLVAQVADFGLSRGGKGAAKDVAEEDDNVNEDEDGAAVDYYRSKTGVFPVRWTAPEAMNVGLFTTASDVWSFGIVAVEAIQNGNQPYGDWSVSFTMTRVIGGFKHRQPTDCPDDLYAIIRPCWENAPSDRPSFATLAAALRASIGPAGATTASASGSVAETNMDAAGYLMPGVTAPAAASPNQPTASNTGNSLMAATNMDAAGYLLPGVVPSVVGYYPANGNGGAVAANQAATNGAPPPLPEVIYHQCLYARMNTANAESGHAAASAQLALLPTIPMVTLEAAAQLMAAHCKEELEIEVKISTTFAKVYVASESGQRHARGMKAIDVAAIHLYTREGPVYKYMNGALGGWGVDGTTALPSYMPYIRLLTVAMSKLPTVELTCYRGITNVPLETILQGCGVGDVYVSNAVISCSASPDVLQDPVFLGFDPSNQAFGVRIVFVIQVKTGVRVEHFSDKGAFQPGFLVVHYVCVGVRGCLQAGWHGLLVNSAAKHMCAKLHALQKHNIL
jgi:serine/threonine protein kinase